MTRTEAVRTIRRLEQLADLQISNVIDWINLIQDEVESLLPERPKLLSRFADIKEETVKQFRESDDDGNYDEVAEKQRKAIKALLSDVRALLESEPFAPDDLKDQIELIIHKGYFKSIYFRTVVGGMALVLLLVTGIEGYKLSSQVKAMEKLVEDARNQVEQSSREVAKARDDSNHRQAELALLILEGDEALVSARTKAIGQIEAEGVVARTGIETSEKRWQETLDKTWQDSDQKLRSSTDINVAKIDAKSVNEVGAIDKASSDGRKALGGKLNTALEKLEVAQSPWMPKVLWSMSKAWFFAPLALVVAVCALLSAFLMSPGIRVGPKYAVAGVVALLLMTNVIILMRMR